MKSFRFAITIAVALAALVAGVFVLPQSHTQADASTAPGFKLGVFMEDTSQLGNFETSIGRPVDMFLYYQSLAEDFDVSTFRPMGQQGKTIQLALEFWNPAAPDLVNQPDYQLRDITAGNWDSDIHRWAREMHDYGYPVRIRPLCEMNGDWTSWSGTVNGNQPSDFIPAWRHIHDIFVAEGATNVKFDWSPNRDGDTASALATWNTYYPGDAYVDYVGMDGYNWGTMYNTPDWTSEWQNIETIFIPSYDVFSARTSKPLMISETASTEQGGSKADWITNTFATLPVRFPRIDSLTWFNINKETDWRVNSSPASLAAFKAAVAPPAPADTTPPTVSVGSPVNGATVSGDVAVSVNASDNVGVTKVELYNGDTLLGSDTAAPYTFSLATRAWADGPYTLTAKAYDAAGNSSNSTLSVNVSNVQDRNYHFGWYDFSTPGMQSWVVIGNPGTAAQHVEVYIAGQLKGAYDVAPNQRVTPTYQGVSNGPVKVVSTTGGDLMVSERSLYNGSFSEVAATTDDGLSTSDYFSWYDEGSPGMRSIVVITNYGSQAADVDVKLAGNTIAQYSVPAGGHVTPEYPGQVNGPMQINSTNGQPLDASQRVVYNGSFNEVPGKAAGALTSEYYFTWFDTKSPGLHTWLVIGNQGSQATNVDVYIGGRLMGRYNVPVGGRITPDYVGTVDGPVHVVSTDGQPLIASQRSIYMNSFEEVLGTPDSGLGSHQYLAWYDYGSPGMTSWVLIGNQGTETADVDVKIGGSLVGHYTIPAGGRVTPVYPGQINGPVEVNDSGSGRLVVSERVIYNSSFDEIVGRTLQ